MFLTPYRKGSTPVGWRAWTREQIEAALAALPGSDCSHCMEARRQFLNRLLGEMDAKDNPPTP